MENQSVDTSPPATQVKKENEEEIKEFAETAMNELLGWYGYERLELRKWAASRAKGASSPDQNQEQRSQDECSWCNKSITSENGALQQAGATFCSELCFSQSRRANFKRAKTCDWCRHVRHTVAYVDFQDGATQLQFCSDKCLNQYKMHIFCRETQAHLDLNPHLVNASSNSNLITPDLWLKNCKSRSPSPSSERSKSPITDTNKPQLSEKMEPTKPQARKSPLPLITIAPTAKLMKQKAQTDERVTLQKSPETKKDFKNKMNLRKRRTSKCSSTVTSQTVRHSSTPKAQDLRMHSPSLDGSSPTSTIGSSAIHSPPHHIPQPLHPPPFSNPGFPMPPGINPAFLEGFHPHPRLANEQRHPLFPPRFNFMPRPGMQMPQERPGIQMHQERPVIPPPNFPPLLNQAPPVTVLVPYPVILPVPIPIPIPIPLSSFLQAHLSSKVKSETKNDDVEGPLDFTMNSNNKKDGESTASDPAESAMVEERIVFHERADSPKERLEEREMSNSEPLETSNPEHTLPKFKITRIGNKMAKILPKSREPSESSRPLRKRRRLVDVATEDDALIPKTRKVLEV